MLQQYFFVKKNGAYMQQISMTAGKLDREYRIRDDIYIFTDFETAMKVFYSLFKKNKERK